MRLSFLLFLVPPDRLIDDHTTNKYFRKLFRGDNRFSHQANLAE
jgi:hypothetical protein